MTRSISSRNCSRRVRFFASYSRSAKVRCFIVRSQNSVALLCHRIAGLDQSFLRGPQGRELTITAGPEVKNFAQMKVGDQVNAEYLEALTLELKKGGKAIVARTEETG